MAAGAWKKTFMAWLTPTPLISSISPSATSGKDAQLQWYVSGVERVVAGLSRGGNALVDEIAEAATVHSARAIQHLFI